MGWNHRLVKHEIDNSIGIYEVYYNEDGSIKATSDRPLIVGNDLEDLKQEIINIQYAFNKPLLICNNLGDIKE